MTPSKKSFEMEFAANIFRFGSHSWLFWIAELCVPDFSRIVFTKFGVLDFLWISQKFIFLCIVSARIFRAC